MQKQAPTLGRLLTMVLFALWPFTRLVHVWSAPIWYLGRQGYQVVRTSNPAPRPRAAIDARRRTRIIRAQRPVTGAGPLAAE